MFCGSSSLEANEQNRFIRAYAMIRPSNEEYAVFKGSVQYGNNWHCNENT